MGANSFNEMELDAIGEMMNISLGASATAVSTMLGKKVNITTPVVNVFNSQEFEFKKLEPAVGVEISYVEGLDGSNIMMFSRNDVRIIVGILMGAEIPEETFELDEINRSAICEVMNQMMGASATALSEFLGTTVNISTPTSFEIADEQSFKEKYFSSDEKKVVVRFTLEIEDQLKSEFLNIMSVELAKHLLEPFEASFGSMSGSTEPETPPAQPEPQAETQAAAAQQPEPAPAPAGGSQQMSQAEIEAMMKQMSQPEPAQPEPQPASTGGSQQMSQAEIEAMMKHASQPEPPQPEPAASQKQLTQEEIQAMMQQSAAPQPGVPQAAPQMQQPYPQMPYPQMPYQQAADPMMLQLLNQMQQSQMHMMEMMRAMEEKEQKASQKSKENKESPSIIRPCNSAPLEMGNEDGEEERANQEMLMKVPLEISVEIGRTKKLVKDILEFTQGSLVVLDKMAGEQADLYVNGQCIARGDIVVVEDNFGIRITEIVSRNINPESL